MSERTITVNSTGERRPTTWRCRILGHRWVYGVPTVPDCHIWDCARQRCRVSQIRGELR